MEKLLKAGVSTARVAALVEELGVNFTLNAAVIERLNKAGADGNLMVAVGKAAEKYASAKAKAEEKKPAPAKQKPSETKKTARGQSHHHTSQRWCRDGVCCGRRVLDG